MNVPTSALDDPENAHFAWDRYRRLMRWMTVASASATILGLGALRLMTGPIPWQMLLFTALGIFFSVLLAAALMGLVFLSAGTGHDEAIYVPFEEDA